MAERRVNPDKLRIFVAEVFKAAGVGAEESLRIAGNLVEANLYGHDSHGCGLLPTYIQDLAAGEAMAGQSAKVIADCGSMIGFDGQKGFGQSIGIEAMAEGIARAEKYGVAIVGVGNTHHLARIGHWGEQCARAGLASVHFVNVIHAPTVAPWGGRDARLVTNPVCVAVPFESEPLVLDFATSATAYGKVRVAYEAGKEMPPGKLIDSEGKPTNDPSVLMDSPFGAILPFGEYKGAGLAFMCEVLGGALMGGLVQDKAPEGKPLLNNMMSIIFKPYQMRTKEEFEAQVKGVMDWVRSSPSTGDGETVFFPGEVERRTLKERSEHGIPLAEGTLNGFFECARFLGIENPESMI